MNKNKEVSQYINEAPTEQKKIMEEIRKIIHSAVPKGVENYKWSRPVFSTARDFAYLKSAKAYVTLGFFEFQKLEDEQNLLEGTGKDMRHIKIRKLEDINSTMLGNWFKILSE